MDTVFRVLRWIKWHPKVVGAYWFPGIWMICARYVDRHHNNRFIV